MIFASFHQGKEEKHLGLFFVFFPKCKAKRGNPSSPPPETIDALSIEYIIHLPWKNLT